MDPSLVVLIIFASLITLVGMPWVIFWGIAKLRAQQSGAGGTQLRRSDLEAIIGAAVEEANAPVIRRLEALEAIATDEEVAQSRIDAAVLAGALEPDDASELPDAARQRLRG